MNLKTKLITPFVTAAAILVAGFAHAAQFSLITSNLVTVNGALFELSNIAPAGTGVIRPIVRLQSNGIEQGYNTSGRSVPFNEKGDPNFTHDLQLRSLAIVTSDGKSYYEFMLDLNQPKAKNYRLVSLDALRIYTSPIGSQNTTNVSSLGTMRFDLGDNFLMLDAGRNHGSGSGDMSLLVPTSLFAAAGSSDFVYLYSKFGVHSSALGGFEEWATVVPEPSAAVLLVCGAAVCGLGAASAAQKLI